MVYLKLENWQVTGSFKARGAMNKILQLPEKDQDMVVTASTGNHAEAVSYSLDRVGGKGVIFLPENVSGIKIEKLKFYKSVRLEFYGNDSVETEEKAKNWASENGYPYVSPYNDMDVICGQGTIGYEIVDQLGESEADCVFVPVGGGGLISGVAGYLKHQWRDVEVIGCQPVNSAVMSKSINAGRILDIRSLATISDGTAGGVEKDAITFEFCQKLVDSWVLVSEQQIKRAVKLILEYESMIVEGSAGLSLAALLETRQKYRGKKVILILCGSKINADLLREIVCGT